MPVWFMRQAGRYLPEYQKLKERYTLDEMFRNPELAAEITRMPVTALGVDAAIMFADILTLPSGMGFKIRFSSQDGPVIENRIRRRQDFEQAHDFENLEHIENIIRLVNEQLPNDIPLIGFAGSPFTVLTYLLEGRSSLDFKNIFDFVHSENVLFHRLMQMLTKNTVRYLNLQKDAGVKVFQLFDTWAGRLTLADFNELVLPYVRQIFDAVDLPSIYFVRECRHLLDGMDKSGADFLSVCDSVKIGEPFLLEKTKKGIQGNLWNELLLGEEEILGTAVIKILEESRRHERYIFNLNHGILPSTDPAKVKFVVEKVHEFKI